MGYYKPCPEFDECNRLIAEYYEKGLYRECFRGHLALAEAGYPLAQCQVGWFYYSGLGVAQDFERAFYWTELAARNGDRDAQFNLSEFYRQGCGTQPNPEQSRLWLLRSAQQGSAEAQQRCKELGISLM